MIPPFTLRNTEEVEGAIFISCIAGAILWAVLWSVFYELRVRKWLNESDTHTMKTQGKVISVFNDPEHNELHIHYNFTASNGTEYRGTQLFPRFMAEHDKIAFTPGDAATIIYNPDNPKLNYIEGYLSYYRRSSTSFIHGLVSMVIFMTTFSYSKSMVWPFVAAVGYSMLIGLVKLAIAVRHPGPGGLKK